MKHMVLFLAEGFEEIEAVTIIDLLRRAKIKVTTVSIGAVEVTGGHGITMLADVDMNGIPQEFDGLILPGGGQGTANLAASDALLSIIRKANDDGRICAAICAAPSVLAKAGILENVRTTCFPGVEDKLDGARYIDAAVVRDGTIVTGRSAGTAIAFSLELIAVILDLDAADHIRSQILY